MPRYSEKSQYKNIEERIIYVLHSPLSKEFYIGHCQPTSLLPIYRQHCAGDRYQTSVCIEKLKAQDLHPCVHILEEIVSTQVDAYSHVIAWTKVFVEAGYISLNKGNVMDYIEDLYKKSKGIYDKYKNVSIMETYDCKSCVVSNYGRRKCPLYKGEQHDHK